MRRSSARSAGPVADRGARGRRAQGVSRAIGASSARRNTVPTSAGNRARSNHVPSSSSSNINSRDSNAAASALGASARFLQRSTPAANRSSCGAVAYLAISTRSRSDDDVTTRHTARTLEYDNAQVNYFVRPQGAVEFFYQF